MKAISLALLQIPVLETTPSSTTRHPLCRTTSHPRPTTDHWLDKNERGRGTLWQQMRALETISNEPCSTEDQAILEEAYKRDPKPDKAARLDLVKQVALGEKEVQVGSCTTHLVASA